MKFEREDWTSFRTIEGLTQKAGVAKSKLTRLVLKEIADNALDTGTRTRVEIGELPDGGYFVADTGPGIGTPEEIARLFSIKRPMISTKLLRLPQRGALGNGLRVVAGAVLASGGTLVVVTRDRRIQLRPEHDGTTTVVAVTPVEFPVGTRVEISFGEALPCDPQTMTWAKQARHFATYASDKAYTGRSSPWWYDPPQFHELLSASGNVPVRELIAELDGCSGGRAGEIVAAAGLQRSLCKDVTREQAAALLKAARNQAKPVRPIRLGAAGAELFGNYAYACVRGTAEFGSGEMPAEIPFVIEAWASKSHEMTALSACVNRTPVTGNIRAARDNRNINIFGCGLAIEMDLEVETVEEGKRHKAVADYVLDRYDRAPDGTAWEDWLQTHRVELNAMTTPQSIDWLDAKMAEHGVGKLVPPADVLTAELEQRIEKKVRETLTERILREANLDGQVKAAIEKIEKPGPTALAKGIKASFKEQSDRAWRDHIEAEAKKRTLKI